MKKTSVALNKVSIIMPAFNAMSTVERAVKSVCAQSFTEWELLICDDGSTDDTFEIISTLSEKDPRISIFKNEKNSGVSYTRNFLLSKASCAFIAFLDADDEWFVKKLEIQINFMESNNVDFTCTPYVRTKGTENKRITPRKTIAYSDLLEFNDIPLLTTVILKNNNIRFHSMRHEDYKLWLQILKETKMCYSVYNEPLARYNVTPQSITSNKVKSFIWHVRVLLSEDLSFSRITLKIFKYVVYQLKK